MRNLLSRIQGPTLLLDEAKCIANIKRMYEKFHTKGISLRPHLKTPQSAYIANFLSESGIHKATVSSLQMAEYFAGHGWDDLCLAFPYNPLSHLRLNSLAQKINLSVVVTDLTHLQHIQKYIQAPLGLWIKINTGSDRTGIQVEEKGYVQKLIDFAEQNGLHILGLLAHSGHTYGKRGSEAVEVVHRKAVDGILKLKGQLTTQSKLRLSYGDTPACALSDYFPEIDEVRPGNFMFYDLVMSENLVCQTDDIAVVVACPVVAKHPERQEVVLYGGAVHMSKDSMQLEDGQICYGKLAQWTDQGWAGELEGALIRKLSQEHGILKLPQKVFDEVQIGDVLPILPVHSCLTVDCMPHYYNTAGEKIEKFRFSGNLK